MASGSQKVKTPSGWNATQGVGKNRQFDLEGSRPNIS